MIEEVKTKVWYIYDPIIQGIPNEDFIAHIWPFLSTSITSL